MAAERRKYPRRAMKVLVRHQAPKNEAVTDYATDLSQGGLFIQTRRKATLGDTFELEFAPAEGKAEQRIKAIATVARVTAEGIGARFTQLDSDSALLLNLLLAV